MHTSTVETRRGKAGRVVGNYVGLLGSMKGIPTAYNKDMQVRSAFRTVLLGALRALHTRNTCTRFTHTRSHSYGDNARMML